MGEVFSQAEGFRSLGTMAGALGFHAVFSAAGMSCFAQAGKRRQDRKPEVAKV
jgi:hypothetical protein